MGSPLAGCQIQVGYKNLAIFLPISRYISQTIQDSAIAAIDKKEGE